MVYRGTNIVEKLLVGILVCLFFSACRRNHETYVKLLSNHRDDTIITLGHGHNTGGYIAEELDKPGRMIFLVMDYPEYQKGDRLGVKIEELLGYSMHSTKVDDSKFEVIDGKKVFRKYVDVPVYRVWELQTIGIGKD